MKEILLENVRPARHVISDYLVLTKPGIVSLVLMSALTGVCVASRGLPDFGITFWTMIGIGISTAGAAVLNNYIDRDIDRLMERTHARSLAVEAVTPNNTFILGSILTALGIIVLGRFVNHTSAILTAYASIGYVILYTLVLKRRSSFANQVGGIAGALPPAIGYVAVTNSLDTYALILFLLSAVWQQPHALSIALKYKDEYKKAGIPVVPVTKGVQSTKMRIVLYSVLLLIVSVLPYLFGMAGIIYLATAIIMNSYFLILGIRFLISKKECDMRLFFFSIIQITVLFAVLVLDMKM